MKAEYDFSNARPNPYVDKLRHGTIEAHSGERCVSMREDAVEFVDEFTPSVGSPEDASGNPASKA